MSQELEEQAMKRAEARHYHESNQPMDERLMLTEDIKVEKSPQDLLRNHEINIRFLNKGAVIHVGCQAFAFSTNEEAMDELLKYVQDPKTQIEKYS